METKQILEHAEAGLGGLIGSFLCLSIAPPKTHREGVQRAMLGILTAFAFTRALCQYWRIPLQETEYVLAVACGKGFAAWYVMAIAHKLLTTARDLIESESGNFVAGWLRWLARKFVPSAPADPPKKTENNGHDRIA